MGITILPTKKREKHSLCLRSNRQTNVWRKEGAKRHSRFPLENYGPIPLLSLSPKPTADDLCVILLLLLSPFSPGQTMPIFLFTSFFLSFGRNNSTFFSLKGERGEETRTKSKNFNNNLFFLLKSACFPISFLKKISRNGYFLFLVNILLPNRKKRVWRKKQRDYNSFSNAPRGKKRRKKCGKGEKVG